MNKLFNISNKAKKRFARVVLLNFLLYSVFISYPQKDCDGMCSLTDEVSECCDIVEMTCCEKMKMNSFNNKTPCGMEINEHSCDYEINTQNNRSFIIPKTPISKIVLIEISTITSNIYQNDHESIIDSQNQIPDISPPILLLRS